MLPQQRPVSRAGAALPSQLSGGMTPDFGMMSGGGPVQAMPIGSVRPVGMSGPVVVGALSGGRPNTPGLGVPLPAGMRPPSSRGSLNSRAGGNRPITGRLGTGQGGQVGPIPENLAPLNTDVQVTARPVTSGGITGMSTKPLGPGRQIADKSYFLSELRNKLSEIEKEITTLINDSTTIKNDNIRHGQLVNMYENTLKEVRKLEGDLADLNLAIDKARTHTDINELSDIQQQLHISNEKRRSAVDELYLETIENEKMNTRVNEKIAEYHHRMSEKIASLGEERENEWNELQEESVLLDEAINAKQAHLAQIENRIHMYTEQMNSDSYQLHQRGVTLQKEYKQLVQQQASLEEETNTQLSPQDLKDKLTKKIKDDNKEIERLEKTIKQVEEEVEKLTENTRDKENELSEAKKYASKAKKYDAVFERERKMQEFIDSFPQAEQMELSQKKDIQSRIVLLMQHISKQMTASNNMPDIDKYSDMKQELNFKQEKMKNAADTLETLSKELQSRKEELTKIENLDLKIAAEIKALKERMNSMQKEMTEFKSDEELKLQAEEIKKQLSTDNQRLKKQREAIKQQVSLLSGEYEQIKKKLGASDVLKRLENMESKLRTYAQTSYQLEEYVNSRKRDSEYDTLALDVNRLADAINALIKPQ